MIKVLNQYIPVRLFVLFISENALILVGAWALISLQGTSLGVPGYNPSLFFRVFGVTAICQFCLYFTDTYDLRSISSKAEVLVRLLQAFGAAGILFSLLFYFFPNERLGAGIVEASLLLLVFLILAWRITIEWLHRAYVKNERILLVGSGRAVESIAREVALRPDLRISVIGAVNEPDGMALSSLFTIATLGCIDDLETLVHEAMPDRLVIALRERRQSLPVQLLLKLRLKGIKIEEASDLYEKITGKIPVESVRPSSLIFSDGFRYSRWRTLYGPFAGTIASSVLLVLLAPLLVLVAVAIKLESAGPIIYRQLRVGLNGRTFEILKFRSMTTDAEAISGPVWAKQGDPRITRVGRFLRKTRLDELPQFFNVLSGQMSFVGPRPERPHFVRTLIEDIPLYELRHTVRPGITGWAQVCCDYGASVEEAKEKLEYDLFYIKNFCLSLDLLILFKTIKIVVFGRGAR